MLFVKFKSFYFSFAENFVNYKFLSCFSILIDRTICFPMFVLLILVTFINNQILNQPFTSLINHLIIVYVACALCMFYIFCAYASGGQRFTEIDKGCLLNLSVLILFTYY